MAMTPDQLSEWLESDGYKLVQPSDLKEKGDFLMTYEIEVTPYNPRHRISIIPYTLRIQIYDHTAYQRVIRSGKWVNIRYANLRELSIIKRTDGSHFLSGWRNPGWNRTTKFTDSK